MVYRTRWHCRGRWWGLYRKWLVLVELVEKSFLERMGILARIVEHAPQMEERISERIVENIADVEGGVKIVPRKIQQRADEHVVDVTVSKGMEELLEVFMPQLVNIVFPSRKRWMRW